MTSRKRFHAFSTGSMGGGNPVAISVTGRNLPVSSERMRKIALKATTFEVNKVFVGGFKPRIRLSWGTPAYDRVVSDGRQESKGKLATAAVSAGATLRYFGSAMACCYPGGTLQLILGLGRTALAKGPIGGVYRWRDRLRKRGLRRDGSRADKQTDDAPHFEPAVARPTARPLMEAEQAAINVTIINQYYMPDVASTGQLLHSLALGLRTYGADVDVLTARPSYGPRETWIDCPTWEEIAGVRVRRVWTPRFGKDRTIGRLLNVSIFLIVVAARMLVGRRDRIRLYVSNPPILGWIGGFVSLVRPHRFALLIHDAYPQVAVWAGAIRRNGFVERVWHAMNRLAYGRAGAIVVLSDAAKTLLCEEYRLAPERVNVIHNWADGDSIKPRPKAASAFAGKHGLIEPFALLYSGNLGLCYDFETILSAATRLEDAPFRLVLVGSGGKRAWLQREIQSRKLANTLLLPYQPLEQLDDSLNACDASLVTIAPGIEGISFPSKLYSSLAVGKPVLALCPPDSELRRIVEEYDAGVWAPIGDTRAAEAAIRWLMAHPARCQEQGNHARQLFEAKFTRGHAAARYVGVLRTVG